MPLIALEILEKKIRELILVIGRLNEENNRLVSALEQAGKAAEGAPSPETVFELENLKARVEKYKKERAIVASKIASAINAAEAILKKEQNG